MNKVTPYTKEQLLYAINSSFLTNQISANNDLRAQELLALNKAKNLKYCSNTVNQLLKSILKTLIGDKQ